MNSPKLKVGDVVTLKSAPDRQMTVEKIDEEGRVFCVYFTNDGKLTWYAILSVSMLSIVVQPAPVISLEAARLQEELDKTSTKLTESLMRQDQLATQIGIASAILRSSGLVGVELTDLANAAVLRSEQYKTEGNAQIARLQAQLNAKVTP